MSKIKLKEFSSFPLMICRCGELFKDHDYTNDIENYNILFCRNCNIDITKKNYIYKK